MGQLHLAAIRLRRGAGAGDRAGRWCRSTGRPAASVRLPHPARRRRTAWRCQGSSSRTCLQYGPVSRPTGTIRADEAIAPAVTADVWLFRGAASPIAPCGWRRTLPSTTWRWSWRSTICRRCCGTRSSGSRWRMWTGDQHRGAQLHRLEEACRAWTGKYGQRAYVRQFTGEVTRAMEDELLRVISTYDGRPFPTTRGLMGRWLAGRATRRPGKRCTARSCWRSRSGGWACSTAAPVQLVRPRQVLERRSAGARRRRPPRAPRSPWSTDRAGRRSRSLAGTSSSCR